MGDEIGEHDDSEELEHPSLVIELFEPSLDDATARAVTTGEAGGARLHVREVAAEQLELALLLVWPKWRHER